MSTLRNRILVCSIVFSVLYASALQAQEEFKVMFYNIENLYDTINNPLTNDDELTPDGKLHWSSYRYHKKIEDISKAISSLGGKYPPVLVGLAEVENKEVLSDLTQKSSLVKHKYKFIITKSKDSRGSNVALLYQRDQFKVLEKKTYRPVFENEKHTRDILHVVGKVVSGDTLDLFICHYPSRSEGVRKSRPQRIETSRLLKRKTDSIFEKRNRPKIIIMGDFNDYPHDISIKENLQAKTIDQSIEEKQLYNLFAHHNKKVDELASYKYNGKWGYFDQFIVSGSLLLDNESIFIENKTAHVFAPDFLLEEDMTYGGVKPLRTYSGWKYKGGTSDHLPIFFNIHIKEN